jgi:hypothetical protein
MGVERIVYEPELGIYNIIDLSGEEHMSNPMNEPRIIKHAAFANLEST